jgi:hypothetical protein
MSFFVFFKESTAKGGENEDENESGGRECDWGGREEKEKGTERMLS